MSHLYRAGASIYKHQIYSQTPRVSTSQLALRARAERPASQRPLIGMSGHRGRFLSLDRLDLRAWSGERFSQRFTGQVGRPGWTAVTWIAAGGGGAGAGRASRRSCGVLPP